MRWPASRVLVCLAAAAGDTYGELLHGASDVPQAPHFGLDSDAVTKHAERHDLWAQPERTQAQRVHGE